MRKRKAKMTKVSALMPTPLPIRRWEYAPRITFTKRTTPLSDAELAGLEIPDFLKRTP